MKEFTLGNGKKVMGEPIGFTIESDALITLELADGAKLHFKPIVLNVIRTNEIDNGERLYLVQSTNQVMVASAADGDKS